MSGDADRGSIGSPEEKCQKAIDGCCAHASGLVDEMAELAQLVDNKVRAYTGAEPADPTRGAEPVPACTGRLPQLAAYLRVIGDYISWIRRSIDQL